MEGAVAAVEVEGAVVLNSKHRRLSNSVPEKEIAVHNGTWHPKEG